MLTIHSIPLVMAWVANEVVVVVVCKLVVVGGLVVVVFRELTEKLTSINNYYHYDQYMIEL